MGKFNICFRQEQLTSHAGTVLLQDFAQRLGVERVLDEELQVKTRERGYSEGQAIGGLVYNLILGGEHLSDLEVLRGDPGTQELLDAETILAPTTAGEFLRKFDIGDVHDLQRVHLRLQQRVRAHQQATTCTIDLDSSIYEQCSTTKEGSTKAYNGEIGYHPLLAFWAEEGELLFSHLRRGSAYTARNIVWFLRETCKRVPATAAKHNCGPTVASIARRWSSGVKPTASPLRLPLSKRRPCWRRLRRVPEQSWRLLPEYDLAEVAELRYQPTGWDTAVSVCRQTRAGGDARRASCTGNIMSRSPTMTARSAARCVVWHLQHADDGKCD